MLQHILYVWNCLVKLVLLLVSSYNGQNIAFMIEYRELLLSSLSEIFCPLMETGLLSSHWCPHTNLQTINNVQVYFNNRVLDFISEFIYLLTSILQVSTQESLIENYLPLHFPHSENHPFVFLLMKNFSDIIHHFTFFFLCYFFSISFPFSSCRGNWLFVNENYFTAIFHFCALF